MFMYDTTIDDKFTSAKACSKIFDVLCKYALCMGVVADSGLFIDTIWRVCDGDTFDSQQDHPHIFSVISTLQIFNDKYS